jgi:hypothetical protein
MTASRFAPAGGRAGDRRANIQAAVAAASLPDTRATLARRACAELTFQLVSLA